MRRQPVMALVVALWLASPAAGEGPPDPNGDTLPQEQAAVAATVRGLFKAVEKLDLEQVEAFHLYGSRFSKFDELGLGREDASQTRAGERRDLASLRSFRASVGDLEVDVIGVAAVATFILDYSAETSQGTFARAIRSTLVLAKDGARWRIVHEHFSPLAKP
jgi:hypothetical protein